MGKDHLDDLELNGPITLRILNGIAWDFTSSKMMDVMEDREMWRLNLELLPPQPSWKSGKRKKKTSWFCFANACTTMFEKLSFLTSYIILNAKLFCSHTNACMVMPGLCSYIFEKFYLLLFCFSKIQLA